MPASSQPRKRKPAGRDAREARSAPARLFHEVLFQCLVGFTRVVGGLPRRWILWIADRVGDANYLFAGGARRVGLENLDVVFGDTLDDAEKRRILRQSMRQIARGVAILFHAAPLNEQRVRAWVEVDPETERRMRAATAKFRGGVVVSGHLGSWEMLVGIGHLFRDVADVAIIVEAMFHPVVDRFLRHLRGSGGARSALRKGGAQAMSRHVRRGGYAGVLIDRNARRALGGIYAPFFGIESRTTPLPGFLARRNDVPIVPVFCLPAEGDRYRLIVESEPSLDVRTDDVRADVLTITTRLNRLMEDRIRAHPECWDWTIKRFKSRPTEEQGRYPSYSFYEP